MKLTCPGCGAVGSLELFTSDADWRAFAAAMGQVPPSIARPLVEYFAMFRPARRLLTPPRLRKLIEELLPMIRLGTVQRHGRDWLVPPAAWEAAIAQMVASRDKLKLPLKSHGYLLEILTGDAGKAEAAEETQREQQRRDRSPGDRADLRDEVEATGPRPLARAMPDIDALRRKQRERLGD